MPDDYTLSLCREYLNLCAMMQSGEHDADDRRELSRDRTWTHNELIRVLGEEYARPFDMKAHARLLLESTPTAARTPLQDS